MTNLCCPHCGNKNIQVTTETNVSTTGKNYSGGKGCLGFLMFGPLGLLCGSCGGGQKTTSTSTTYWVCPNCGHKFESPTDLREKASEKTYSLPLIFIIGIAFAIGIYFLVDAMAKENNVDTEFPISLLMSIIIGVLFCIICPLIIKSQANSLNREAENMEEQMRKFSSHSQNTVNTTPNNARSSNQSNIIEPQGFGNECKYCGATIGQGTAFCASCGSRVQPSEHCRFCGAVLKEGAAFCTSCGANSGNNSTAVQSASQEDKINVPSAETYHYKQETAVPNNIPRAPQGSAGPNEWKCPTCGVVNQNYVGTCGCGTRRP